MTPDQKQTLRLSALGGAGLALVLWGLLVWLDGYPGPLPDPGERIALVLKLCVLPAGFLLVVVHAVALARLLTGAVDPLTDAPPEWRKVDMRVLANTVEQTVIFIPLLLAATMIVRADETAWLVALPVAFVLARCAFWIGYRVSPMGRAPGMAAGFFINLGLLGFVVVRFFG
ncbi:MAG: hypothetical protein COW30_18725 [Rhodospirillales bacterium CG15_BIG_FIL_POST_REV_8_21_14_020_66_15]|nr:MAG: hypothetical protein COW30_18725 [Rhodospirillales bacterium CG15_BIG_FIL_POST_REV_8_21_14_020_66_15]